MHILHISAVRNWGGGENHLENLYVEVAKKPKEYQQIIICAKDSKFHKRLAKGAFHFIPAPMKTKMDLRFSWLIKKVCKKEKVDIIHIHDPTALTLCVIADRLFGNLPPFVLSKKTSFPIRDKKPTLFKYNYKKIKRVICVSHATAEVAKKSITDTNKIITIYNGIRFDNKTSKTEFTLRDKYKIDTQKTIIGNIGNHITAKDLGTFVEVVNEIVNIRNIKDVHFVQIGTFSNLSENYFDKMKQYGLEDYITFTDYIDNASAYLSQFDIFLFTSQSEGLPQVINEAFYFKIPVVSTNAGGIAEIIKNGENGVLTAIGDHKALADGVVLIKENKEKVKQFISKSHKQITEGFSSVIMAKKTLELYKEVLK